MIVSACAARAQMAALEDLASFPTGAVVIETAAGAQRFEAWIADTPPRQSQGLMFVRELPADRAMVFVHRPPRVTSMWMKNTYIELDMLFVAAGRIAHLVRRARPHSLESIDSRVPVDAVIEIRGGEADRRGLRVGDRVRVEQQQNAATYEVEGSTSRRITASGSAICSAPNRPSATSGSLRS